MRQSSGEKGGKIGLTGGIGAGKSTVAARLAALGAHVIDADAISRAALARDGACYGEALALFGPEIVKEDGEIDRPAVAARIFSDEAARQRFNAIVHPYVLNTMFAACEGILRREENGLVVFDVPLLFECGADRRMDANVVVVAEDALRIARICRRSGMSEEAARARIRSQISQREQMARADYVIDNSGGLDALYAQVDRVYAALRENTAL